MKNPVYLFRESFSALDSVLRYSNWRARDAGEHILIELRQTIQHRTLRELLILFNESGYSVWLYARPDRQTLSFARKLGWHPKSKLVWRTPARNEIALVVTDDNTSISSQLPGPKTVRLHFDLTCAPKLFPGHFAMPYPMHPQLYAQYHELLRLETYRQVQRKVRGMFAGNWDSDGYKSAFSWQGKTKLSRYAIISAVQESGKVRVLSSEDEFQTTRSSRYPNEFLLLGSRVRIFQADWLRAMASADFFLCPPGLVHAWSHNLIEAMAVGTIPITNYPEWMFPPLEHGINCLAFETLEDLRERLREIETMSQAQIERMRANVIGYYEEWLNPQRFVAKLFAAPENPLHLHLWGNE